MRRSGLIAISIILVLGLLVGLSAARYVEFDRPPENEMSPNRSSYNAGPTGTRAFYQTLEESGRPVSRWRRSYLELEKTAASGLLIVIGPIAPVETIANAFQFLEESQALQRWVSRGGQVLHISRSRELSFEGAVLEMAETKEIVQPDASAAELVDANSDRYLAQPTVLTRGLRGLALSRLAGRMRFIPPAAIKEETESEETTGADSPPPPAPSPTEEDEPDINGLLYAPVIHLKDSQGAILADFQYGEGRVIFLSDPFVVSNHGIGRGANLQLAMNLIQELSQTRGETPLPVYFDEYHHGYRQESNALVNYFRGTPMPWMALHGVLLGLCLLYSLGKRFSRPVPLPRLDRHSPLEFVGSMANLQQSAQARDLALENIYPRFRTRICRRLGLSSRARNDEILARLSRQRLPVATETIRQVMVESELVLRGEPIDDRQLVYIVSRLRQIQHDLASTRKG